MTEQKQAIIFDLYGTLLKVTKDPYAEILKRTVPEDRFGEAVHLAITQTTNHPNDILGPLLCPLTTATIDYIGVEAYPETIAVLEKIAQTYKLGLISNLATPFIKPVKTLGLEKFFDTIVYSCEVGLKKPNPEIYGLAQKQLEIEPGKIVMIGDKKRNDYEAPKALGMNAIHLERPRMNLYDAVEKLDDLLN